MDTKVLFLPRYQPQANDHYVPASQIVRWHNDGDPERVRVVLADGSSLTTSDDCDAIRRKYDEAIRRD